MSLDSLTGDDFMSFTPDDHRVALGLYDGAVDAATQALATGQPDPGQRDRLLGRLTSLLTLRKLHKVRLQEVEEDETVPAGRPVSQQYFDNELDQLPS